MSLEQHLHCALAILCDFVALTSAERPRQSSAFVGAARGCRLIRRRRRCWLLLLLLPI